MVLLCCTKKLRDKLPEEGQEGRGVRVEGQGTGSEGGEDDWYANLFRLGRRQAIIFTHAGSLYSFIIEKVQKRHLVQIMTLFRAGLEQRLIRDGFNFKQIITMLERMKDMQIGATRSRSVLGSMNDMVHCARHMYDYYQGEYEDIIEEMMVRLNKMPMKAIGYQLPMEKFGQCYGFDKK